MLLGARDTIELIKQSEMEDFLGGRCALRYVKPASLESVDAHAAVIYPIVFPDRLEVLVSVGSEVRHYRHAETATKLEASARRLAEALRDHQEDAKNLSKEWYRWLLEPAESWMRARGVETLVMVPDKLHRLIPLAALFDGERYVIERYAVATSPGLSLLEPVALQRERINALVAGMSAPGTVLRNLPPIFFQAMAAQGAASESGSDKAAMKSREAKLAKLARDPEFLRGLAERMVLPGVDQEIDKIGQTMSMKVLRNESFTVKNFEQEVARGGYSVVHIASHGVFEAKGGRRFIVAYDGLIDVDGMERLLKSVPSQEHPVELLTLSACQTAEGDKQAPLGLSGIAIKAKVRSALGTLWPVSDGATAELMGAFYQALGQPGVSKVQALRLAQRKLISDPRFAHPFYWAPFILVGNWL